MNKDHDPKKRSGAQLVYFFVALLPIPLGVLTVEPITSNEFPRSFYERYFFVIILACCITGCIGMMVNRKKRDSMNVLLGIFLGLMLTVAEGGIIAFVGCCQSLKGL